jgi:hypothetical protein
MIAVQRCVKPAHAQLTRRIGMPRGRPRKNQDDVLFKSAELIGWALGGIEREILQTRERLASLTQQAAKLRTRVGAAAQRGGDTARPGAASGSETEPTGRRRRRRRRMSPEARKRISEMMKKRWAERRKKG